MQRRRCLLRPCPYHRAQRQPVRHPMRLPPMLYREGIRCRAGPLNNGIPMPIKHPMPPCWLPHLPPPNRPPPFHPLQQWLHHHPLHLCIRAPQDHVEHRVMTRESLSMPLCSCRFGKPNDWAVEKPSWCHPVAPWMAMLSKPLLDGLYFSLSLSLSFLFSGFDIGGNRLLAPRRISADPTWSPGTWHSLCSWSPARSTLGLFFSFLVLGLPCVSQFPSTPHTVQPHCSRRLPWFVYMAITQSSNHTYARNHNQLQTLGSALCLAGKTERCINSGNTGHWVILLTKSAPRVAHVICGEIVAGQMSTYNIRRHREAHSHKMSQPTQKLFLIGIGYIGGSLLVELLKGHPKQFKLSALVRNSNQADKLKELGVEPVSGDLDAHDVIAHAVANADITIHAATADHPASVEAVLDGLEKREATGLKSIYIHTSASPLHFTSFKCALQANVLLKAANFYPCRARA